MNTHMTQKSSATRKRMITCFAQIINRYVPGYEIPRLAAGAKIKARRLSYDSQIYLLMYDRYFGKFLNGGKMRDRYIATRKGE